MSAKLVVSATIKKALSLYRTFEGTEKDPLVLTFHQEFEHSSCGLIHSQDQDPTTALVVVITNFRDRALVCVKHKPAYMVMGRLAQNFRRHLKLKNPKVPPRDSIHGYHSGVDLYLVMSGQGEVQIFRGDFSDQEGYET
jgi:hypothetical protein